MGGVLLRRLCVVLAGVGQGGRGHAGHRGPGEGQTPNGPSQKSRRSAPFGANEPAQTALGLCPAQRQHATTEANTHMGCPGMELVLLPDRRIRAT